MIWYYWAMFNIPRADFESLVQRAITRLPASVQENLNNVDVVIDDIPTDNQLLGTNLTDKLDLLGLYEGVPITARNAYDMILPDKITVFQASIEHICHSHDELVSEIDKTILHEIAHHFGIPESELGHL